MTNSHRRGGLQRPASTGVEFSGADGQRRVAGRCPGSDEVEPRTPAPLCLVLEALSKDTLPISSHTGPSLGSKGCGGYQTHHVIPMASPSEGPLVGPLNSICKVPCAMYLKISLGVTPGDTDHRNPNSAHCSGLVTSVCEITVSNIKDHSSTGQGNNSTYMIRKINKK